MMKAVNLARIRYALEGKKLVGFNTTLTEAADHRTVAGSKAGTAKQGTTKQGATKTGTVKVGITKLSLKA